MKKLKNRRLYFLAVPLLAIIGALTLAAVQKKSGPPDEPIIAAYKKTYPASVSDAVELVTGKNGTMWHDMKLVVELVRVFQAGVAAFVGRHQPVVVEVGEVLRGRVVLLAPRPCAFQREVME